MTSPTFGRRRVTLLLAAAFAFAAGVATWQALDSRVEAGPELLRVVTAARTLPVGAQLSPDDVREVGIPAEAMPEGAVRTVSAAIGRYAVVPVLVGDFLLDSKLGDAPPGSTLATVIPDGYRAVAVTVRGLVNAPGLLSPGDRVDVLGIMSQEPDALAEVVLRDVLVLAVAGAIVGVPTEADYASSRPGAGDPRTVGVTLAVTEEEARRLVQVDDVGRLRLATRPLHIGTAPSQQD